ncbi:MAG: pilus assembly protein [Hyphomicrobiaceae bacterium]|nr:pilus assembly protein [Hyphomicrobiaceae bacterium]
MRALQSGSLGATSILADRRGSIAVKFGLLLPILMLMAGHTVDYSMLLRDRSVLQTAADAAALAAAKQLSFADTKRENLQAVADAVVSGMVRAQSGTQIGSAIQVAVDVSDAPTEVEVTVTKPYTSPFGETFGMGTTESSARAVARIVGKPNICMLGLNPTAGRTISLEKQAQVTGQNCAVYSNSSHTIGLKSKNSAILKATFICTRGGKDGGPGNFAPDPIVDCPEFDDPLIGRPEPFFEACDLNRPTVINYDTILSPGTYCGLDINGGAVVTLRDGVYVFRDKPLIVRDGASLIGTAAGLFFTGKNAYFTFEAQSTISLEAPTDGPMAGILIFGGRSQDENLVYSILSNDARVLIGTIYLPKGELRVDATSPIADKSAYTAIVADKMRLYGGPHLVLNTNYDETDVPVPDGIKGAGQPASLTQ